MYSNPNLFSLFVINLPLSQTASLFHDHLKCYLMDTHSMDLFNSCSKFYCKSPIHFTL